MIGPSGAPSSTGAVQVRRFGTVVEGATALRRLHDEFARQHCVGLPGFLEPTLAETLLLQLDETKFVERVHEGIETNRELWLRSDTTTGAFHLLMNSEVLFRAVEEITSCDRIESFIGRVY